MVVVNETERSQENYYNKINLLEENIQNGGKDAVECFPIKSQIKVDKSEPNSD